MKWLGLALLLCLWQMMLALVLAPSEAGRPSRYDHLNEWDSDHYVRIIDHGYSMPEGRELEPKDIHSGAANVMFYPGYPMASRWVKDAFHLETRIATLVVAQISCWAFWTYFLLILARFGVRGRALILPVLLILIHPAAFYLVAGYTESLFLVGLLGYIFWSGRFADEGKDDAGKGAFSRALAWTLAAVHGLVMSCTRIVSFSAALYPAFAKWAALKAPRSLRSGWKTLVFPLLLGFFAICGTILYFAFLQERFGHWNLYFKLEEVGWGNHRQWLAVINPLSYLPRFFFEDTRTSINRLSNLSLLLMFFFAWKLERKRTDTIKRLGLYFTAFFLYFIPITGKAAAEMDSMVRYALPPYILLSLCFGVLLSDGAFASGKKPRLGWTLFFLIIFGIQIGLAYRFLRGGWIA
jgi:hypothetical protein